MEDFKYGIKMEWKKIPVLIMEKSSSIPNHALNFWGIVREKFRYPHRYFDYTETTTVNFEATKVNLGKLCTYSCCY